MIDLLPFGRRLSRLANHSNGGGSKRRGARVRPAAERLEPRAMLATDALTTPLDASGDVAAWAAYQAERRWNDTATDGDDLRWGDATTITWSIVPDGTAIPGHAGEPSSPSDFVAFMSRIYGSSRGDVEDQPWFSMVASVFDRWSEVSGLDFVYEPSDDGAAFSNLARRAPGVEGVRGDIRVGGHAIDGDSGTLAYNFFPDNGEMVLDTDDDFFLDTADDSLRLRNVMSHELGHGIGLSHVGPVERTKLMEPFASTEFDGPQHDDILAVHRLYGDSLESGGGNDEFSGATDLGTIDRSVVVGDHSDGQYVSIDGATDVDFYGFAVGAGSLLDAALVPIGEQYREGAPESSTQSFDSRSQNDLTLEIYDRSFRLVARADRRGAGDDERLSDVALEAGGVYYARVSGDRDAAQFYRLDLNVTGRDPSAGIDFRRYSLDSHGGPQDHSGSTEIEQDGSALRLTGNLWKRIDLDYEVTPDTVLEFDFASASEGDIHGIGFDSDSTISSGLTFRLHGTQDWGIDEFDRDVQSGPSARHFVIPVGRYYTGPMTGLVFVNDHDVTRPDAESVFSNVRIREASEADRAESPRAVNDRVTLNEDSPTVAIDVRANDQGSSASSVTRVGKGSAGGATGVAADGRIHYRPAADFHGTETFVYTIANSAGSSTATVTVTIRPVNDPPLARDNRYVATADRSYRLDVLNNDSAGADTNERLTIVRAGRGSSGGAVSTDGRYVTYSPANGFVGTESFTYTINDGTSGSEDTARVTVRVEPAASRVVDFDRWTVDPYGGSQDVVGAALVEDNSALRLLGNAWKKIDLRYDVTPNTVLEFDFSSASQGEIHGIGLDDDTNVSSSRAFRLYGTQSWGIDDYATYTPADGTVHYAIPVGRYFTGRIEYLFFINDHDRRDPTAESLFRNVRLRESSPRAEISNAIVSAAPMCRRDG